MILPSVRKMIEWWTRWWSHLSVLSPHVSVARRLILLSVSYLWIFFIIHHPSCLCCISKHAPLRTRVCVTSLPGLECKQHGKHNKYVKILKAAAVAGQHLDWQERRTDVCLVFNTHTYADVYSRVKLVQFSYELHQGGDVFATVYLPVWGN